MRRRIYPEIQDKSINLFHRKCDGQTGYGRTGYGRAIWKMNKISYGYLWWHLSRKKILTKSTRTYVKKLTKKSNRTTTTTTPCNIGPESNKNLTRKKNWFQFFQVCCFKNLKQFFFHADKICSSLRSVIAELYGRWLHVPIPRQSKPQRLITFPSLRRKYGLLLRQQDEKLG